MSLVQCCSDSDTYLIIKAAMAVHNEMGPGFLESVYQKCLEIEFNLHKIPFSAQPKLSIGYKNKLLNKYYIPDFIVNNKIIIELKAQKQLTKIDEAQIINSLKVSNKKIGLLINFGELSLKFKRFIN